jgi:hypothetical protein
MFSCSGQQGGNQARAEREPSLVGGHKRDRQGTGPVAQILGSVPLAFFCGSSVCYCGFLVGSLAASGCMAVLGLAAATITGFGCQKSIATWATSSGGLLRSGVMR